MKDEDILKYINKKFGKVKSTVVRDKGNWVVAVMKPYSYADKSSGIVGISGSMGVLDIKFKSRLSAERLNKKIKQ
jgi:hypothetical protein